MEWDTAAGHALSAAVGCYVFDIVSGTELRYNKPQLINNPFLLGRETAYKEYL
jgi:3'(2'), 5'-bisphosphate nucleotidase